MANILDTFTYVFTSQADALLDGIDTAERGASTLSQAIEAAATQAKASTGTVGREFSELARMSNTALTSIAAQIRGLSDEEAKAIAQGLGVSPEAITLLRSVDGQMSAASKSAGLLAEQLGATEHVIDAMRNSVRGAGGNMDHFNADLEQLSKSSAGPAAALNHLSKVIAGQDWNTAIVSAERMGFTPEIVSMIRNESEALEDFIKQANGAHRAAEKSAGIHISPPTGGAGGGTPSSSVNVAQQAGDLRKVANEMHNVNNEAKVAQKSLDDVGEGLKGVHTGITGVAEKLSGLYGTIVGAFAGIAAIGMIKGAINDLISEASGLEGVSKKIGMSIDSVSALSNAAYRAGGSAETLQGDLETLASKGIKGEKALGKLSDRLSKLSDKQAALKATDLGISANTLGLLKKGNGELQKTIALEKQRGVVTQQQADLARTLQLQQREVSLAWKGLAAGILTLIAPALQKTIGFFADVATWVNDNRRAVLLFLGAICTALLVMYIPTILSAAAATWAFIAPFLPIIAIIAAVGAVIALVVDDVMAFREGNDSLIGDLSKQWPWIGELVNSVCDALAWWFDYVMKVGKASFETLMAVLQYVFSAVKAIFGGFATLIQDGPVAAFEYMKNAVGDAMAKLLANLKRIFPGMAQIVETTFNAVRDFINSVVQWFVDKIDYVKGIWNKIAEFFGGHKIEGEIDIKTTETTVKKTDDQRDKQPTSADTVAANAKAAGQVEGAKGEPLAAMPSGTIGPAVNNTSNRTTTVTDNRQAHVTVNAAGADPHEVASHINNSVGDHMNSAVAGADDGVAA